MTFVSCRAILLGSIASHKFEATYVKRVYGTSPHNSHQQFHFSVGEGVADWRPRLGSISNSSLLGVWGSRRETALPVSHNTCACRGC